jgi:hypothetical protein
VEIGGNWWKFTETDGFGWEKIRIQGNIEK